MKERWAVQADARTRHNDCESSEQTKQPFFAKASPQHVVAWIVFVVLVCFHFCLNYLSIRSFLNTDQYVQGHAATPYQYRVLPMYVFRAFIHSHAVAAMARHIPQPLNNSYDVILFGIVFFSILGAVLATSATIKRLTGDGVFARWMSLLVVYMAYFNLASHWGLNYTLPYDVPSLFFFCMGLYLVITRRWWLYYIMFPFAVLDRETACFLTIFLVVWEWVRRSEVVGESQRSISHRVLGLLPHVVVQAAIWIGIKLYLVHMFASNPAEGDIHGGAVFTGHLLYNLRELLKPQQWPVLLSICGFLLPALWVGRRWIRCKAMSWSCGIVMLLWLLGMIKVGVITEIRVFSEWTAFVVPLLGLIVYNRFLTVSPEP